MITLKKYYKRYFRLNLIQVKYILCDCICSKLYSQKILNKNKTISKYKFLTNLINLIDAII